MRRLNVGVRPIRIVAIILLIFFLAVVSSWAAAREGQICDVSADDALGREDYPAAIVLHRRLLHSHDDNALAHYHLGFA